MTLALGLAASLGAARAERWQFGGEARLFGVGTAASAGQLGADNPTDACRPDLVRREGGGPLGDGGGGATATLVGVLSSPSYRYQLGLSGGYYYMACTPALRRPVGGLDFRGEHSFGPRTRLSTTLRLTVDALDPSLDQRSGNVNPQTMGLSTLLGGKPFLIGAGGVDFEHEFPGRVGFHVALGWQGLELVTPVSELSNYTTLGPMETFELSGYPFRDTGLERLSLPVRYRVSEFYPATLAVPAMSSGLSPRGDRSGVPPAHDVAIHAAYERRFGRLWSLRVAGGLAAAYQPNLCLPDRDSQKLGRCGIDPDAHGVRSKYNWPTLETMLGDVATGTFEGLVGLTYQDRRMFFDAGLERVYEPNAYAGSLSLTNRLSASLVYRVTPDLRAAANLTGGVLSFTVPARVEDAIAMDGDAGIVSPQNRIMYTTGGQVGLDWTVAGPVALFAQVDWSVFALQGERVQGELVPPPPGSPPGTQPTYRNGYIRALPGPRVTGMETPVNAPPDGFLHTERLTVLAGIRLFFLPSTRERDLMTTARAVP